MKVLLVHDYGTPTGGAELQMLTLREGLRARGHDARLFASRAALAAAPFAGDYDCYGTTRRLQVVTQVVNPSAWHRLRRALLDFEPDVVHVRMFLWQLSPAILPLLRTRPSIYHAAVYKAVCPTGTKLLPSGAMCHHQPGMVCVREGCVTPQTWVFQMLQHRLVTHWRPVFRRVVALSHHMKATLEESGFTGVEVIHNGVPERPARPPLPSRPIVGYAGRLSREKGVEVLLRAVARLAGRTPDVQLVIAGDGPEREALVALAGRLGLAGKVTMMGHVSRDEMERAFAPVWVQAAPSLWNEPFGNVATEASMRGTALVVSNTGGLAEIVVDGVTGLVVPPNDDAALAAALERIVTDRDLAERLGSAGRVHARAAFSEAGCLDRVIALYERVVQERSEEATA